MALVIRKKQLARRWAKDLTLDHPGQNLELRGGITQTTITGPSTPDGMSSTSLLPVVGRTSPRRTIVRSVGLLCIARSCPLQPWPSFAVMTVASHHWWSAQDVRQCLLVPPMVMPTYDGG